MKNRNVFLLIGLIVVIIFCGTVGVLVINRNVKNKNTYVEEKEEEEKSDVQLEEIVDISEDEKSILLEQIKKYNTYLGALYPVDDIKNIGNDNLLTFAFMNIDNLNLTEGFMQTDIEKVIKKYFGDIEYHHSDINCPNGDGLMFKYDEATRKYNFYGEHGHGGPTLNRSDVYFIDGKHNKTENKYVVDVKLLFEEPMGDVGGGNTLFYRNAIEALNNNSVLFDTRLMCKDGEDCIWTADEVYRKVKEQLEIMEFSFKYVDGNYALTGISLK